MFKKNPVEYKQPQEFFCINYDCLNETAKNNFLSHLLTEDASKNWAELYCIDCIIEGKVE